MSINKGIHEHFNDGRIFYFMGVMQFIYPVLTDDKASLISEHYKQCCNKQFKQQNHKIMERLENSRFLKIQTDFNWLLDEKGTPRPAPWLEVYFIQ